MGKFKMPTVQDFLKKKKIYDPQEPVWVYLEREMRQNAINLNKPYNEKVGKWLKYLKELRYYFHYEAKRKFKRLETEVGPPWYYELSTYQREILEQLKSSIHQDLIEDVPVRTRKSLADLGLTLKIPKPILMKAMNDCIGDAGIFIWNIYTEYYKMFPSDLRAEYDINARMLLSSLVFIDYDECIKLLEEHTRPKEGPPKVVKKKPKKEPQPDVRYGEYLQKFHVPCYSGNELKKKEPLPLGCRIRLRNDESCERLAKDHKFLEKRKERNKKEKQQERVCNYKFWEPPSTLRNQDPKMVAYINKLKMLKLKPKVKFQAPYKNVQYNVGGVAFIKEKPYYLLNSVAILPTGYIPINCGTVTRTGEYYTHIGGHWKYPLDVSEKCDKTCDCLITWERSVMKYIQDTKCKCGHRYDYYWEGKSKDKYIYPSTKHGKFWFDFAKIYQMDPTEDFIKESIRLALLSAEPTPVPSTPTLTATSLKPRELLASFLADLSESPLLIPHLPKANLLHNLQEWVRKRVRGPVDKQSHKKMLLQSQRRWLDLKHIDFKCRAYRIPFTLKQLHHMNWSHRYLIQRLFKILLNDFVTRNQMKQLTQTMLWWSTTKHDAYPSKAFLDIYFTYMPSRMKDIFMINPYDSNLIPKNSGKTCPL